VSYQSSSDAFAAGLAKVDNNGAYMGVDTSTVLTPGGAGRKSVRIQSKASFTHGLFILDLAHMPGSNCGSWPAFWMTGPDWPNNGEIDIIEQVGSSTTNKMSLHTGPSCTMPSGPCQGNQGCSIDSHNPATSGSGFNSAGGGGVYATEWTADHISIWYWPQASVPADVKAGTPNPGSQAWGPPQANFQGGSNCNIDANFKNMNLVFDTTFCGDWAGNGWAQDGACASKAPTCADFVANNPAAFRDS
jgi:hypothetical protein